MKAVGLLTETSPTIVHTHQGHRMSWSPLVPTAHSTEAAASNRVLHNHFPGSECVGVLSASTALRVQLLLALPDENSLCTKGRVCGYMDSEAGCLVIEIRDGVSGYLEAEVGCLVIWNWLPSPHSSSSATADTFNRCLYPRKALLLTGNAGEREG